MPTEARRLDQETVRCARLAQQQHIWQAGRTEVQKAYERWRQEYIQRPLADLRKESQALERPEQQMERGKLERAQAKIQDSDLQAATAAFRRGHEALATLPGVETKTIAAVSAWVGKKDELVALLYSHSKGSPTTLSADEHAAAVRIGRLGKPPLSGFPTPLPVSAPMSNAWHPVQRLSGCATRSPQIER